VISLLGQHKLCYDDSVRSRSAQSSVPPFGRCQCRTVQDEFFGLIVPSCLELEATDITPVSQLGLSK